MLHSLTCRAAASFTVLEPGQPLIFCAVAMSGPVQEFMLVLSRAISGFGITCPRGHCESAIIRAMHELQPLEKCNYRKDLNSI